MSNSKSDYQWKFEISALLAVVFVIFTFVSQVQKSSLENKVESLTTQLESMEHEIADAYDRGVDFGRSDPYDCDCETIDDMNPSEIVEYLSGYVGQDFYPFEELYNVYIMGFQRGYAARSKGQWNDTIDEYVNGYEFSPKDPLYSRFD